MGSGLKTRFKQVLQHVVTPKNYWSRLYSWSQEYDCFSNYTGNSECFSLKVWMYMGQYCISPDREEFILAGQSQFWVKHIVWRKIKTYKNLSMGSIPGFNCTLRHVEHIHIMVLFRVEFSLRLHKTYVIYAKAIALKALRKTCGWMSKWKTGLITHERRGTPYEAPQKNRA